MKIDDIIDNMSSMYGSSIENFQKYIVTEVIDLAQQGYTGTQIANILNTLDMEDYFLNAYGGQADLDEIFTQYKSLLANLSGFGTMTDETLTALTRMNQATFLSNILSTANTTRQAIASGALLNLSEAEMVNFISRGNGGLTIPQAETLANTALNTYSRQITRVMADTMPDNTLYYYQGPVDKRTRDVCVEMVAAGPLTQQQIDDRFPGAFGDGGGFNCRHRWTMATKQNQNSGNANSASKRKQELIDKGRYKPLTLLQTIEGE